MFFSPIRVSKQIYDKYIGYLKTIFAIDDTEYREMLAACLEEGVYYKGPYIDVTDDFVKNKTIAQYIKSGFFSKTFSRLNLPAERTLYYHQEEAIKKILNNESVVISTGTGSGKTECFLYPILSDIITEYEKNELTDGIRALIIYPMNALANDQIDKLTEILKNFPDITFGSYTGQTLETKKDGADLFRTLHDSVDPLKNHLVSREQMKATPPHILITNYAMLEFLMLRPDDSIFFRPDKTEKWRYIVLDEAHVYRGTTGIEVSMLLRRLKAKIRNKNIQFVLTSATIGDISGNADVAEYASSLCCDTVFSEQNIIRSKRINRSSSRDVFQLPETFYAELAGKISDKENGKEIMEFLGKHHDKYFLRKPNYVAEQKELIYDLVAGDELYAHFRAAATSTKTVCDLSKDLGITVDLLEEFALVAAYAEKEGNRLCDIRYHMFIRANDSVFITIGPLKRLFLSRLKEYEEGGVTYKVFEIATCSVCNTIYIIGKEQNHYLSQQSYYQFNEIRELYLLNDKYDTDEEHTLKDENIEVRQVYICSRCGYISKNTHDVCEHDSSYFVRANRITLKQEGAILRKCLNCEAYHKFGILRMFFTGQEAVTSVLATALYEGLSYKEYLDDFLGQFITFSDNRQAAAYFSTYFDQTYRNILYKRLIVETLRRDCFLQPTTDFPYFLNFLDEAFKKHHVPNDYGKEALKAVLFELSDITSLTSLYQMGLFGFKLKGHVSFSSKSCGINADEFNNILNIMIMGMLSEAAFIDNIRDISLSDEDRKYFAFNGKKKNYVESNEYMEKNSFIQYFVPATNHLKNRRFDYMEKVLKAKGVSVDRDGIKEFLHVIWDILMKDGYLQKVAPQQYHLNINKLLIYRPKHIYICNKCRHISLFNVNGVCPTFRCEGNLSEMSADCHKQNHYYRIYTSDATFNMVIKEHTAQLNHEKAGLYQNDFKNKKINILSCSTTFEMGVDIGSLETVFMRNVPPSPANYIQRAGRAGRSKNSAAYALTFCNRSSHDFTHFKEPESLIQGKIKPPKLNLRNIKIAKRHIYASAFDFFWKKHQDFYGRGRTEQFLTGPAPDTLSFGNGLSQIKTYLDEKPADLYDYLLSFIPAGLHDILHIKEFGWTDELIGEKGVLTKAIKDYCYEYRLLNEAIEKRKKTRGYVDRLISRQRTMATENIVTFLSKKNVLPKYGFPVDTVELKISPSLYYRGTLDLQRDLSMALSEYAPGSQVVADGHLYTSKYIRVVPKMGWPQYEYKKCQHCGTLNIHAHTLAVESSLINCKACATPLRAARDIFLIPIFGFITDGNITKPGLYRPQKTYHSDVSYVGYRQDITRQKCDINSFVIELASSSNDEMAVLNTANFFVCEICGFTVLDVKKREHKSSIRQKHKTSLGEVCEGYLNKYSLGYTFETDVVQMIFGDIILPNRETALSLLYGILKGFSSYFDIEENEISGCLGYDKNGFSLIFFDRAAGGAGYVHRLNSEESLKKVLKETLRLMERCDCGSESADASCYGCLRNYYNQRHHDELSRKLVIDFLHDIGVDTI